MVRGEALIVPIGVGSTSVYIYLDAAKFRKCKKFPAARKMWNLANRPKLRAVPHNRPSDLSAYISQNDIKPNKYATSTVEIIAQWANSRLHAAN